MCRCKGSKMWCKKCVCVCWSFSGVGFVVEGVLWCFWGVWRQVAGCS